MPFCSKTELQVVLCASQVGSLYRNIRNVHINDLDIWHADSPWHCEG